MSRVAPNCPCRHLLCFSNRQDQWGNCQNGTLSYVKNFNCKIVHLLFRHLQALHLNGLTTVSRWSTGHEFSIELLESWSSNDMGHWELDLAVVVLHGRCLLAILAFNNSRSHDLDRTWSSTMTTSQFRIHLFNGFAQSNITVFLVHVVGSASRIVTKPDTVVLDNVAVTFDKLQ